MKLFTGNGLGRRNGEIIPILPLALVCVLIPLSEITRAAWFARGAQSEGSAAETLQWKTPPTATSLNLAEARGGEILAYDEGAYAILRNGEESRETSVIYLEYERGNDHMLLDLFLHSPEICLPATGAKLEQEFLPKMWMPPGQAPLVVRHWLFRAPVSEQLVHAFKVIWVADNDFFASAIQSRDFQRARLEAAWQGKVFSKARMILAVSQGADDEAEAWQAFESEILAHCIFK